jgi:hypothetical protein
LARASCDFFWFFGFGLLDYLRIVVTMRNLFQQWNHRKYRCSRPLLRQVPVPDAGWRLPRLFSELGQNDLVQVERGHAPKSEAEAIQTAHILTPAANLPPIACSVVFAPAEPNAQ